MISDTERNAELTGRCVLFRPRMRLLSSQNRRSTSIHSLPHSRSLSCATDWEAEKPAECNTAGQLVMMSPAAAERMISLRLKKLAGFRLRKSEWKVTGNCRALL